MTTALRFCRALCLALGLWALPLSAEETLDPESDRFLRQAVELLLRGEHGAAGKLFDAEIRRRPEEVAPRLAQLMLYQLQMYEQDDFAKEQDFRRQSAEALKLAQRAVERRGGAWDHTMEAAIYGLQGLLQARREHWLTAGRLGLKAKGSLERAVKLDPELADAHLGLGVFHYYGSVLTKKYWFLPGFGDHRGEGLGQVQKAREQGRYLKTLAEFTLLYIYYEEKRYGEALELALDLAARYPENALGRSWVGWMQFKLGRYDAAARTFEQVCDGGTDRYHCLYHLGTSRLLQDEDLQAALSSLQAFLATEPSSYWRARAYYRIGLAHLRLGDEEAARSALRAATYIDPEDKMARERLTRLEAGAGSGSGLPSAGARGRPTPLARWKDS